MSVVYSGHSTYVAACKDCEWASHAWGPGPHPQKTPEGLDAEVAYHVGTTGHTVGTDRREYREHFIQGTRR